MGFRKKNGENYIINKGTEHTGNRVYDENPEILVSIQTYELNDVINNQVYCVIKGNQDCLQSGNEPYLFNNKTKANEKFLDLYILYNEYGYDVKSEKYTKYFNFDNNNDDWGHCKTELIKIESENEIMNPGKIEIPIFYCIDKMVLKDMIFKKLHRLL